jgi:hypothetical protein
MLWPHANPLQCMQDIRSSGLESVSRPQLDNIQWKGGLNTAGEIGRHYRTLKRTCLVYLPPLRSCDLPRPKSAILTTPCLGNTRMLAGFRSRCMQRLVFRYAMACRIWWVNDLASTTERGPVLRRSSRRLHSRNSSDRITSVGRYRTSYSLHKENQAPLSHQRVSPDHISLAVCKWTFRLLVKFAGDHEKHGKSTAACCHRRRSRRLGFAKQTKAAHEGHTTCLKLTENTH